MEKERGTSKNPYGKQGDDVAKQIIDRVLVENFKKSSSEKPREKSIGEMSDEILKLVHEKVEILDFN